MSKVFLAGSQGCRSVYKARLQKLMEFVFLNGSFGSLMTAASNFPLLSPFGQLHHVHFSSSLHCWLTVRWPRLEEHSEVRGSFYNDGCKLISKRQFRAPLECTIGELKEIDSLGWETHFCSLRGEYFHGSDSAFFFYRIVQIVECLSYSAGHY